KVGSANRTTQRVRSDSLSLNGGRAGVRGEESRDLPCNRLRCALQFSRPFGTRCFDSSIPPLKGWAIFKSPSGRQQRNSFCYPTAGRPNNAKAPARCDPPLEPRRAGVRRSAAWPAFLRHSSCGARITIALLAAWLAGFVG